MTISEGNQPREKRMTHSKLAKTIEDGGEECGGGRSDHFAEKALDFQEVNVPTAVLFWAFGLDAPLLGATPGRFLSRGTEQQY